MKHCFSFLIIGLLLICLCACDSEVPIELIENLEEEEMVLEEIDPLEMEKVYINETYSYLLEIEENEIGENNYVFRLFKANQEVKVYNLGNQQYVSIHSTFIRKKRIYLDVTYSPSSGVYKDYLIELNETYDGVILHSSEKESTNWEHLIFQENMYILFQSQTNQVILQCFTYEHQFVKTIKIETEKRPHLIYLKAVENVIYLMIKQSLIEKDEFLLYRISDDVVLLDTLSKDYMVSWKIEDISILQGNFHFYIYNYEQQFGLKKEYHRVLEYNRGILSEVYSFLIESKDKNYFLEGILYLDEHFYLVFSYQDFWYTSRSFVILHYDRKKDVTTYMYSKLSLRKIYKKDGAFYISLADKVYKFVN